ncbi:MAG: hypothetical protein HC851_19180 [Acaryochloris sp. RU_4_1]|nr:hypothetical protein [Acaryochloris sp. RU_4_1]
MKETNQIQDEVQNSDKNITALIESVKEITGEIANNNLPDLSAKVTAIENEVKKKRPKLDRGMWSVSLITALLSGLVVGGSCILYFEAYSPRSVQQSSPNSFD